VRVLLILAASVTAITACSRPNERPVAYALSAAEGPGIEKDDASIIIPDARKRLPATLSSCGVEDFRDIPVSDHMVRYAFEVPINSKILECIRETMPRGAELREAI
jgi:hypothetical protein